MEERKGAATYKGQPVTLVGPEVKAGQRAPFFKAVGIDMQGMNLSQSKGKVRLLSAVHSLDIPVCDLQTQLLEQEAGEYPNVVIYTISMDLPFAQARYSREYNIRNLKTLSDYKEASFGMAYGLLIKETRLLSRAVFIVDADDMVRYVEYVKEITEAPDYYKAIKALKSIAEECSRQG
jgi:thioredoxin-dependent peroxiredoxin